MIMAARAQRAAILVLLGAGGLPTLAGCLVDDPPDPRSAPLEVVLDGCQLNRPDVEAGPHEISIIGEGRLSVTDEAGAEVLEAGGMQVPENAPAATVMPEGYPPTLLSTPQTYTFTCTVGSTVTSSTLESLPAADE